eukprot:759611-Hanusia_phi.AAC.1
MALPFLTASQFGLQVYPFSFPSSLPPSLPRRLPLHPPFSPLDLLLICYIRYRSAPCYPGPHQEALGISNRPP